MFKRFLSDRRGNYAVAGALAVVPLLGATALAVDYGEASRIRSALRNSLDAACLATGNQFASGASDKAMLEYGRKFFASNVTPTAPKGATFDLTLPETDNANVIACQAKYEFQPYIFPAFASLMGFSGGKVPISAESEIRLKNTLEVSLVLDNSGSMTYIGTGSGDKRIDILKRAAKELIAQLSRQGQLMKQVAKPVQVSVVPFSASVNVGSSNANAAWMDTTGRSPVHHENFNWASLGTKVQNVGGVWYARGTSWGALQDKPLTRLSLFDIIKRQKTASTTENPLKWEGCVESRVPPYNVTDDEPTTAKPETLFVPMFGPDEPGNIWTKEGSGSVKTYKAANSWWDDGATSTNLKARQRDMSKYLNVAPQSAKMPGLHEGPNQSCATNPILPLTDISKPAGDAAVNGAIDAMQPFVPVSMTNVPEGLVWGWRVVSHGSPFTEGRPDTDRGNDKVVIVLTDGENTYRMPSSYDFEDPADNRAIYNTHGYTDLGYNGTSVTRLFMGTGSSVGKSTYSNWNYTKALNSHFETLCNNAKAAGVIILTVALDLSNSVATERDQITNLRNCASESRYRRNSDGSRVKLFWNSTGGNLAEDFKAIGNELSNLRIVG